MKKVLCAATAANDADVGKGDPLMALNSELMSAAMWENALLFCFVLKQQICAHNKPFHGLDGKISKKIGENGVVLSWC